MRCTACATTISRAMNFCPHCGTPTSARPATGEFRQMTMMFVDLVDSTGLSERVDAEVLREVVDAFHAHVDSIVRARGGSVAQHLGDGVLVYFGFPIAHEDDARRGILAGLDLLAGRDALNRSLDSTYGVQLSFRTALHSGEVVMNDFGSDRHEQLAVGRTVNIAARLSGAVPPDTLVVSAATRRLAELDFVYEPVGTLDLKGVSGGIAAFRVVRERNPFEQRSLSTNVATLVGRREELDTLLTRFHEACSGAGRIVVVTGEPGIGKTHLLRALRRHLGQVRHLWIEGRCSQLHQASPLHPVRQLISSLLGCYENSSPEQRVARARERVAELHGDERTFALLATLLEIPAPERFSLAETTPQQVRNETIEAVARICIAAAAERPVVVAVEDVHWTDPSTVEVLDRLVERIARSRLLLVVTARSGMPLAWTMPAGATPVRLPRLERDALLALIFLHTGGCQLPEDLVERIIAKSDGIPLFAEELTRMVVESRGDPQASGSTSANALEGDLGIPATLHGSLLARLDRLPHGKAVAQVAATIGRPFSLELLCRVSELPQAEVQKGVEELEAAHLVQAGDGDGAVTFAFRHSLVQDAANHSLLHRDRRRLHARVAEVLEHEHPEIVASQPELIAMHYTSAGRTEDGIRMWQHAGHRAVIQSAASEASHHYGRALDLLALLPESTERDARELDLRLALGNALVTSEGYASTSVEHEFTRAAELCDRAGEAPALFRAIAGLFAYHLVRGDPEATEHFVERLGEVAERSDRDSHVLVARYSVGSAAFYAGDFAAARTALADATERFEAFLAGRGARQPWRHTATGAPFYLGWCLHLMGWPDAGLARQEHAVKQAEKTGDAYVLVEALTHMVALLHDRREPTPTLALSDRVVTLCERYGFRFWLGIGKSARGWARCHVGDFDAGLEEIREGLAIFRGTGSMVPLVYRTSYLVEALFLSGRIDEGLAASEEALACSRGRLDRFYDAELLRLRGELLRRRGPDDDVAAASFRQAIELARRQGARLLELRAATSMAHMLADAGRIQAARELLEPVQRQFDEGFGTPDLREAGLLLERLSGC